MLTKKYKFIEHMADLEIEVWGKDQSDLFTQAALAIQEFIFGDEIFLKNKKIKSAKFIKNNLHLTASDVSTLLADFMSEILGLIDIYDACFYEFSFKIINEKELEVEITGSNTKAKEEIKAITYHRLKVEKLNNMWQARVVADI